jgi:hypothetical protein
MSCPRPPLCFAPPPGRPHGLGRRRPFPLHRPASLSTRSSVLYREGGEVEDGCFAHTPCPFSTFPNRTPPIISLSSFFKNQTLYCDAPGFRPG